MKFHINNPPSSIRERFRRNPLLWGMYGRVRDRFIIPFKVARELEKFQGFKLEEPRIFKNVLVETINICNSDCSFCPVNFKVNPRSRALMPMELMEKIACELRDLKWSGRISLYNSGEPLADPRIVEIVKLFCEKCPEASTRILTNAILLNKKLLLRLMDAGLTDLKCNAYKDGKSLIKPLKKIIEEDVPEHPGKVVHIQLREKDAVLLSRGGDAPNKRIAPKDNPNLRRFCDLPFKQLVILVDGSVPLCCNDVFNRYMVGDIKEQTLLDVWVKSEELRLAREKLLNSDRRFTGVCARCDYHGCKGA